MGLVIRSYVPPVVNPSLPRDEEATISEILLEDYYSYLRTELFSLSDDSIRFNFAEAAVNALGMVAALSMRFFAAKAIIDFLIECGVAVNLPINEGWCRTVIAK